MISASERKPMPKQVAETNHRLNMPFLKKHKYLPQDYSHQCGTVNWTCGSSRSSISICVKVDPKKIYNDESYINLQYTNTSRWDGEKSEMNYKIPIITTHCNFGGVRYWFKCCLSVNGRFCGRRVGSLYQIGKYFGCRHCANITYQSKLESGKIRCSVYQPDIDKLRAEIKRRYYKGQPTRKYKRYLKMNEKLDMAFYQMTQKYGKMI